MQLTYIPIQGYEFYCIPQCKYIQLLSRSKNPVYLYQHRNSRQSLVVKQIPFDKQKLKIYSIIRMSSSLKVLLEYVECVFYACKIKGNFINGKQNLRQKNTSKNMQKTLNYDDSQLHMYNEASNQSIFIQKGTYGSPSQVYIQEQPFDDKREQEQGNISKGQNQANNQKKSLLIWMQYYRHSLPSMVRERRSKRKSFTKKQAADFLLQMVTVLEALQRKGLAHRDIKPQNVLYSQQKKYKLCDFDEAIHIEQELMLKKYKEDGLNSILQPTTFAYCSPSFYIKYIIASKDQKMISISVRLSWTCMLWV